VGGSGRLTVWGRREWGIRDLTGGVYTHFGTWSTETAIVNNYIKATLEKHKGDKDWGQYLMELHDAAEEEKRRRAFAKIRKLLTEEDYENMRRSDDFRERLKLG
jgi:hypothetical protein